MFSLSCLAAAARRNVGARATSTMPLFDLVLSAGGLEGVARITCTDTYCFRVKFDCGKCRQPTGDKFVVFTWTDEAAVPGSRGTANAVLSCSECKAVSSISITSKASDALLTEDKKTCVWGRIECRGAVPVTAELGSAGVTVHGASGVSWEDADVASGEFAEYDEASGCSVVVEDVRMSVRPAPR